MVMVCSGREGSMEEDMLYKVEVIEKSNPLRTEKKHFVS